MEKVKCDTCDQMLWSDERGDYEERNLGFYVQCKPCTRWAISIQDLRFCEQLNFRNFLENEKSEQPIWVRVARTTVYYDSRK